MRHAAQGVIEDGRKNMTRQLLLAISLVALGTGCGGDEHVCDKFAAWANKCEAGTVTQTDIAECKVDADKSSSACHSAAVAYINCITKFSCASVKDDSCQAESDKADSVCE
jgi:hypothetical protein